MKKVFAFILACVLLLSAFTVTANAATKPVPGYYVVGTMNDWSINKDYLMVSAFDGHYALYQTKLTADDELKVVYSADGLSIDRWYPEGVDNNYIPQLESGYSNIEFAPNGDAIGEQWHYGYIWAYPCEPPIGDDPTEPEHKDLVKELWESGAPLTAEAIEEAANEVYKSGTYFYAEDIHIIDSYRFENDPAYVVNFEVKNYFYYDVMLEEHIGNYLLYTSLPEPYVFDDNKLYTMKEAYEAGVLTDAMLTELAEVNYTGGSRYGILTEYIIGDADGSGKVDIIDATYIQRYDAYIIGAMDFYKPLADVDGNNKVNVIDAVKIQRYKAGLLDSLR